MTPGILIEGLVVILLIATIGYCALLSNRLKKLKSEESALRATIAELLTATELAERAIRGLKVTANEHQKTLGLRVRDAEKLNAELQGKISAGNQLMDRLVAVIQAGSRNDELERPKRPEKTITVVSENKYLPAERRTTSPRQMTSQPRSVSQLAAEATARITALRKAGG